MTIVTNPTWYADIRFMFTHCDIDHMQKQSLDLTSYDNVVANAGDIYAQVASGNMPPGASWKDNHPDYIATFLNWLTNGFAKGTSPSLGLEALSVRTATRLRKNIAALSTDELDLLRKAFSAIIAKPADDPNSYFIQAGFHWLPSPVHCQHHAPAYNPWHRAYLVSFENALRSVPGCESLTLPFWDITTPFPEVLKHPPFDSYVLPKNVGQGFDAGYVTTRFSYDEIQNNLEEMSVSKDIGNALTKTDWEDFHGLFAGAPNNTIIAAHDSAHDAIGLTMSNPLVAAFDPIFFFFHANWDRLFWQWQRQMRATDLAGLLTTINKTTDPLSYQIFTTPALRTLAPFTANPPHLDAVSILDLNNLLGIDYEDTPMVAETSSARFKTTLSVPTAKEFVVSSDLVDVRVDGINRLNIPGSFKVHLLKDGKRIATRGFFQPDEPNKCETCTKNAIVHFDFDVPLADISGGKLGVVVEPMDKTFVGERMPNKMIGSPTVSVRVPMKTE